VLEGIGRLHFGEALDGPVAKRPAAGREHDPSHAGVRMPFKALEDCIVLAVDRKDFRVTPVRLRHHELPGEHEDLLRGQRKVLAGSQRGKRGFQACCAHHCDQHSIGARKAG
jgi:hypothetical protein